MVKWNNPEKGVAPSPMPWCHSYWKGSLRVTLNYGCQLYFCVCVSVYMISSWRCADSMDFLDSFLPSIDPCQPLLLLSPLDNTQLLLTKAFRLTQVYLCVGFHRRMSLDKLFFAVFIKRGCSTSVIEQM